MYTIKTTPIDNGKGYWAYNKVEIFKDEERIGEYVRKYSSMYNTFVPFTKDGKDYALFSDDYTTTSVMSLPECKKIASEKHDAFGFCPVDFYVPINQHGFVGQFGFVAGCVWGDDHSWKVQLLDLRQIEAGEIKRINFAYHELPDDVKLKDAFEYEPDIDDSGDELTIEMRIKTNSVSHIVEVPKE